MEWQIVQTIVYLVTFLGTVCGFGIKLSNVIQRNTHAINSLNDKLNELTEGNRKDHEIFYSSINKLKTDVAVLAEKNEEHSRILEHDHKWKRSNSRWKNF